MIMWLFVHAVNKAWVILSLRQNRDKPRHSQIHVNFPNKLTTFYSNYYTNAIYNCYYFIFVHYLTHFNQNV